MADVRLRPPVEPFGAPIPARVPTGPRIAGRLHALVLRIDAATPAGRNRAVDVLRAFAIAGVVLGHWLVTAVRSGPTVTHGGQPAAPHARPDAMSWVLQTLALFFFVGGQVAAQGYASARTAPPECGPRLFKPAPAARPVGTGGSCGCRWCSA